MDLGNECDEGEMNNLGAASAKNSNTPELIFSRC